MRRLIYAGLLSTTMLSSPAQAGPIGGFLSGLWAGLTTGAVAGAGITGAWASGAAIGAGLAGFAGTALGRIVLSVGLSALSQALAPKPKMPPPAEVMANYAQDVSFMEFGYGRVRKGGPYAFSAFSSGGITGLAAKPRRHYGVLIAAHPTKGPVAHYLDKWEVVSTPDRSVTAVFEVDGVFTEDRVRSGLIEDDAGIELDWNLVLLTGQDNAGQNGLWEVKEGAWTRPAGFTSSDANQIVRVIRQTVVSSPSVLGLARVLDRDDWWIDMTDITMNIDPQEWINQKWPGAGLIMTSPIDGRCKIRSYTGQAGQSVDPIWSGLFPEVGAGDDFAGLSYAALYAERPRDSDFSEVYPSGREWAYAPVWDMEDRVLDPRTGLRGWTNNAALVIADVAVRWYGKSIDWDEVAEQADICDELVTNRSGGQQARWTINTVIRSNMTWEQARAHLTMCCDAFFYERADGKLGFMVGYFEEPTVTLTDADFVSVSARNREFGIDEVYSYAFRYVEPAREWSEEVTGPVIVGSNPAMSRAEEECFGITSHNQAWRCAYRWAKSARPEWRISGQLKFVGRSVMGQRFVRLQLSELGIDAVFEVATLSRQQDHSWQLEAVSVEAEDFAPDAVLLEPARPTRAVVAEDGTVPPVASLAGEVVDGTGGVAQIEWTWPEQTDDLRQRLRVRVGAGDWNEIDVPAGQTSLLMTGLVDGATYEAQARNVTPASRLSAWAPIEPVSVQAVANTTAPDGFSFFTAMLSGSSVALSWTAPNDAVYAAARIYRATDSTTFGDATLVGTEYGAANATDEWTDAAPGVGAHSYWIEPINGSGIPGPVSGPQTITIS